ncbi:EamA family transporter [Streptomyces spiralis]|uniref:EamA family transporter n=1 Tax=Streptomyces spiralis TaxID=66376 RepID=UPI003674965B
MAIGALCVSASAVLLDLAGTAPGTASFYRCVLALPALLVPAAAEHRREGPAAAILLLLTPVGAVVLSALVLREHPNPLQLGGCALILVSAYVTTARGTGSDD